MADWISFWDSDPAVFAGARHRRVHYARVAADLARFLPDPDARMLDFGCGHALSAPDLAARCGSLVLCDAAPRVCRALEARFAGEPKIAVATPEEVFTLPEGSFSLITVHSVIQFVARPALVELFAQWRRLLKKGGSLILSDVLSPDCGRVSDAAALVTFAFNEGFLLEALLAVPRARRSPYRQACAELGLSVYGEHELLSMLETARLPATRVRPNVGYNQSRMAIQAFRLR